MTASNPVISMIVGPAGYTGKEMWRIGGPLSLVYIVVSVAMVQLVIR
jgi:di/tricarboxylate transporter